jgi:hypothetical protein
VQAATKGINQAMANSAFNNASTAQKLLGVSNAIEAPPSSINSIAAAVGNSIAIRIANSSLFVQ